MVFCSFTHLTVYHFHRPSYWLRTESMSFILMRLYRKVNLNDLSVSCVEDLLRSCSLGASCSGNTTVAASPPNIDLAHAHPLFKLQGPLKSMMYMYHFPLLRNLLDCGVLPCLTLLPRRRWLNKIDNATYGALKPRIRMLELLEVLWH